MVLYFTGTGNSRHIAERIAHALNDTLISLNDRIKSGDITPLAVNGRLVLVMPTYAWRIPRIVRDHLLRTELRGARETWFVMDCGSEIGNAAKSTARSAAKRARLHGHGADRHAGEFHRHVQHANRRGGSPDQPPKQSRSSTARSPRSAQDTCSRRRAKTYDRIASSAVNPVFYPPFVKANPFTASDVRIGCGKCEKLCPLNNITLQKRPSRLGNQLHSAWPAFAIVRTRAIEYGKKSAGKPRYHFEEL